MCGRYALTRTELLEEFFEFSFTGNQILPRFNVAPTTQIPVIRLREDGQRELIESAMGIDASLVDEIESSPSFSSLAFNRDVG